jgi:hypothetical protein
MQKTLVVSWDSHLSYVLRVTRISAIWLPLFEGCSNAMLLHSADPLTRHASCPIWDLQHYVIDAAASGQVGSCGRFEFLDAVYCSFRDNLDILRLTKDDSHRVKKMTSRLRDLAPLAFLGSCWHVKFLNAFSGMA